MKLMELITQYLAKRGIAEVYAIQVTIDDVERMVIKSDNDPALGKEVGDGKTVKLSLMQSAKAGLSGDLAERLKGNIKTGIFLNSVLAYQAEVVAGEMNISFDRFVNLAVKDFVQRYHRNRQVLEQFHQAGELDPDEEERRWLTLAQESYRRLHLDADAEAENPDQLSNEEFEKLLDELAEFTRLAIPPGTPPLSDYALSRESFYEDHPKL